MATQRNLTLTAVAFALAFACSSAWSDASQELPVPKPTLPSALPAPPAQEVIVETPEPRFAAPTRRDRIGRIWAPVFINGQGPFRLVLDTGANHSAVTAHVADVLGITPTDEPIMLHGVTGSATVPIIRIDSLSAGDLRMNATVLPIVPDALGGAEGVLGTEGLADKRILIDFHGDRISIARSRGERAAQGYLTIPVELSGARLLVVEALVGGIPTKAIIDTGGQATIANTALHDALARKRQLQTAHPDEIIGATDDVQWGESLAAPMIRLGDAEIKNANLTYGDLFIFEHWKLTRMPAMLIGMDVLGMFDTLIIDYRRHELQVKMRS